VKDGVFKMFDRRWVTDVALAALIAFPAVLPATPAPRSAQSALSLHPGPAAADRFALADRTDDRS
jgi:hypothetical protein